MKRTGVIVLLGLLAAATLVVSGCGQKAGAFGEPITITQVTPIGSLFSQPQQFSGTTVRIEGTIAQECPTGGWFMLKDATGIIFVDLHPSNFAIPQASGHSAVAQGVVQKEGPQVSVVGKGVEVR